MLNIGINMSSKLQALFYDLASIFAYEHDVTDITQAACVPIVWLCRYCFIFFVKVFMLPEVAPNPKIRPL